MGEKPRGRWGNRNFAAEKTTRSIGKKRKGEQGGSLPRGQL